MLICLIFTICTVNIANKKGVPHSIKSAFKNDRIMKKSSTEELGRKGLNQKDAQKIMESGSNFISHNKNVHNTDMLSTNNFHNSTNFHPVSNYQKKEVFSNTGQNKEELEKELEEGLESSKEDISGNDFEEDSDIENSEYSTELDFSKDDFSNEDDFISSFEDDGTNEEGDDSGNEISIGFSEKESASENNESESEAEESSEPESGSDYDNETTDLNDLTEEFDSESEPENESENDSKIDAESLSNSEMEDVTPTDSSNGSSDESEEPESENEDENESESESESEHSEMETEAATNSEIDVESESNTETNSDDETDVETAPEEGSDLEPQSESESGLESSVSEYDSSPEAGSDLDSDIPTDSKLESESESESESLIESETVSDSLLESVLESESEEETKSVSESEPESEEETTPPQTPTRSVSPSLSVSPSPSRSVSASPSASPSRSISASPSRSVSASPSRSVSPTASQSPTASFVPTRSPAPTRTPAPTPLAVPAPTPFPEPADGHRVALCDAGCEWPDGFARASSSTFAAHVLRNVGTGADFEVRVLGSSPVSLRLNGLPPLNLFVTGDGRTAVEFAGADLMSTLAVEGVSVGLPNATVGRLSLRNNTYLGRASIAADVAEADFAALSGVDIEATVTLNVTGGDSSEFGLDLDLRGLAVLVLPPATSAITHRPGSVSVGSAVFRRPGAVLLSSASSLAYTYDSNSTVGGRRALEEAEFRIEATAAELSVEGDAGGAPLQSLLLSSPPNSTAALRLLSALPVDYAPGSSFLVDYRTLALLDLSMAAGADVAVSGEGIDEVTLGNGQITVSAGGQSFAVEIPAGRRGALELVSEGGGELNVSLDESAGLPQRIPELSLRLEEGSTTILRGPWDKYGDKQLDIELNSKNCTLAMADGSPVPPSVALCEGGEAVSPGDVYERPYAPPPGGLSGGAIAGIIISALLVAAIAAAAVLLLATPIGAKLGLGKKEERALIEDESSSIWGSDHSQPDAVLAPINFHSYDNVFDSEEDEPSAFDPNPFWEI